MTLGERAILTIPGYVLHFSLTNCDVQLRWGCSRVVVIGNWIPPPLRALPSHHNYIGTHIDPFSDMAYGARYVVVVEDDYLHNTTKSKKHKN
jgi:hypothetical protein